MSLPKLLVVDTNPDFVKRITQLLSDHYEIYSSNTVADAVRQFEKMQLTLRIVLLKLNTEAGFDAMLIKKFKSISTIPEMIALSDVENIRDAVEVMKEGAYAYLAEPFSDRMLLDLVENALDSINIIEKLGTEDDNDNTGLQDDLMIKIRRFLQIPRAHGKKISAKELNESLSLPDGNGGLRRPRILVVEDEGMYRKLMTDILSPLYDVVSAQNGAEAIRAVEQHSIDVILLDIFLPDGSGEILLPKLREKSPDTQVVIVTAFEFVDIATRTLRSGACDYINKPFMKNDILAMVEKALDRKYLSELPSISQQFVTKYMSEKAKTYILYRLCLNRQKKGKPLFMKDIYLLFPEFKKIFLPPSLALPNYLINENITHFIKELKEQAKQLNTTTD